MKALKFASIWLLNPMVATISTRGSSEGLLGVMVIALLWAILSKRVALAGMLLGMAVHFKIYPFIYGISIMWYLENPSTNGYRASSSGDIFQQSLKFFNPARLILLSTSFSTFMVLNTLMYYLHGTPFLQHTYFHHLTRIDHRHNFSPYNTLLHLTSFYPQASGPGMERLAFLPQLFLSAFLIPLVLAKRDLPGAMLTQTFAFVTFNKVCTSQYFLWYLVLLPFYLPYSSLVQKPSLGFDCDGSVGW